MSDFHKKPPPLPLQSKRRPRRSSSVQSVRRRAPAQRAPILLVIVSVLFIFFFFFLNDRAPFSVSSFKKPGTGKIYQKINVREESEPWRYIDAGKPLEEYSTPYVLQQGAGETVQIGDIVAVRKYRLEDDATQIQKDFGTLWFWIGFPHAEERFGACGTRFLCEVESGIVGMPVGTWFYYPLIDRPFNVNVVGGGGEGFHIAGRSMLHPITGAFPENPEPYLQQQFENSRSEGGRITAKPRTDIYHIVQRCPARLRKRRITVSTKVFKKRHYWVEEAELNAVCSNGSSMQFKQMPLRVPPPQGMDYESEDYWHDWYQEVGRKTPAGLRINPAPQLDVGTVSQQMLEKIQAINELYPDKTYNSLDGPGYVNAPLVVVAGQAIQLSGLKAGLRPASWGDVRNVTITGYRMDARHSHGQVHQDVEGNYYYMADKDYLGPAYFYVMLTDATEGVSKERKTAEAAVPLLITTEEEAARHAAKAAQRKANAKAKEAAFWGFSVADLPKSIPVRSDDKSEYLWP